MTDTKLLPCPLCGEELWPEGAGFEHPHSDTCPLDSLYIEERHVTAWNRRAPVTVAQAARVLLADEDALFDIARAYDAEDAAQRGEPDPHSTVFGDDTDWLDARMACARAALTAIAKEEQK